jgi:arabinosaccharide transport system permease protein
MKSKLHIKTVLLVVFFSIVVIITLLPLILLSVASLRPGNEIMRNGLNFNINYASASLKNYIYLFSGDNSYFYWYRNSIVITIVQVFLSLFLSACVAYGLAMYNFKGRALCFGGVLLVMMIPTEIILLPLYRTIVAMKIIDTIWGIILPYLVVPILIFFFYQYLRGIPRDFLDAARVDGCTEYGIFAKIMIPLMKPSFAAMGIYEGMQSWNNFLWPMIVIRTAEKNTLPVGLSSLLTPYGNNYDVLIAGSCFAIIPVLILFICFQSYFIDGMTAGGVKE